MSTSFWLDRTSQSQTQSKNFDVTVIGAGISGLSAAFWLHKEDPSLKIAVIERNRIGYGATGRCAGFITCGSVEHFNRMISKHGKEEAIDIWKFSEKNLRLLEEHVVEGDAAKIGFEKKGSYSLAAQDSEFAELKKVAEIMKEIDIPVQVYTSEEVEKNVGAVNFAGAIRYIDDASVHPVKMCQLMLSKMPGVTLIENTEVYGWEKDSEGNNIVKTDNGNYTAAMVVLALNAYSPTLNPFFADKIYPTRGQILMMEKMPQFMHAPCYANFYLDYFRQLPTGELLIGGFRQLERETEVGYSDHTTQVIQDALHKFVTDHLPQYKDKKVTHRWGGVMGFSKDGQPMVGSLPEDNSVFYMGGYTGHGIGLAFNTGKCLTDLIFGREVPKWISGRRFN